MDAGEESPWKPARRRVRRLPKGSWPLWFVGFAFLLNRNYGGLFMIALLLAVLLQAFTSVPVFLHP